MAIWRLVWIRLRAGIPPPILHVPLWLERHQSVFTHVRWRSFLSVRLKKFFVVSTSNKKKNQSWNKEIGVTEIRTANPSSEIVELPTRPRGIWRFRSVEEPRRKKKTNNCSTFRAPRPHFSPLTLTPTPTLTLTLLKYPYPNPNPNPSRKTKTLSWHSGFSSPFSVAWVTRMARAGWRWNSCP